MNDKKVHDDARQHEENKVANTVAVSPFLQMNEKLQPIDEMMNALVSQWRLDSQVFVLNRDEDIVQNSNHHSALKDWTQCDEILQKVSSEIDALDNDKSDSVLDLILEKVKLMQHISKLHKDKGQNMSQIMFEATKRIKSLQSDLTNKNKEMAKYLEVKETMYAEIQQVKQKVETLTREYQVVVRELDHVRGRRESMDSSNY